MKDYHYELTEEANELLRVVNKMGRIDGDAPLMSSSVVKHVDQEDTAEQEEDTVDYDSLHKALQDRLYKHRKKKQITGFGNVSFIPSLRDLQVFLARFREEYPELWNLPRIEKCLLKHIDKCHRSDKFSPAIKYFIIKQGTGSQLASYLESNEDDMPDDDDTQHDIKNLKDLFE